MVRPVHVAVIMFEDAILDYGWHLDFDHSTIINIWQTIELSYDLFLLKILNIGIQGQLRVTL